MKTNLVERMKKIGSVPALLGQKFRNVVTPAAPVRRRSQSLKSTVVGEQVEVNPTKVYGLGVSLQSNSYQSMAEELRMIKRPLLNNIFGPNGQKFKNANLIMVTSCFPGEGKSFCTMNLAMNIAMELDRTVLLVDADVSKPSIMESLGVKADLGLLDILQDRSINMRDVLVKTSIPNLSLLPAGRQTPNATELLASEAMASLLDDMAQRYQDRVILFDSPPLMVTTESSVLTSHMGQILMVIEAGKTPVSAIKTAIEMVEDCSYVGIAINKTQYKIGFERYGYGYGTYGRHPA